MPISHRVDRSVFRIEKIGLVDLVVSVEPDPEIIVDPSQIERPLAGAEDGVIPKSRRFLVDRYLVESLLDPDLHSLGLARQRELVGPAR